MSRTDLNPAKSIKCSTSLCKLPEECIYQSPRFPVVSTLGPHALALFLCIFGTAGTGEGEFLRSYQWPLSMPVCATVVGNRG